MNRTIAIEELDLTITYSIKDDSPRGCRTIRGIELKVGDKVLINNHFHEVVSNWENQSKTVTLTNAQWNKLTCYILMTTNYRKGEREAWETLSKELNEDGTPTFTKAPDNIKFWELMEKELNDIKTAIEKR